MMALDHTGKAFADTGARHIDLLSNLKQVGFKFRADANFRAFAFRQAKFPQPATRLA